MKYYAEYMQEKGGEIPYNIKRWVLKTIPISTKEQKSSMIEGILCEARERKRSILWRM